MLHFPVNMTKLARTRIIPVRIRVARSESTFWIPILAKIAVREAKTAENKAQTNQQVEDNIWPSFWMCNT